MTQHSNQTSNDPEQHSIVWEGIEVNIDYQPSWSKAYFEIYGYGMAHIEIRVNQPVPITETGYRSLFIPTPNIEEYDSVSDYVTAWLNHEAQSPKWKRTQGKNDPNQLNLF